MWDLRWYQAMDLDCFSLSWPWILVLTLFWSSTVGWRKGLVFLATALHLAVSRGQLKWKPTSLSNCVILKVCNLLQSFKKAVQFTSFFFLLIYFLLKWSCYVISQNSVWAQQQKQRQQQWWWCWCWCWRGSKPWTLSWRSQSGQWRARGLFCHGWPRVWWCLEGPCRTSLSTRRSRRPATQRASPPACAWFCSSLIYCASFFGECRRTNSSLSTVVFPRAYIARSDYATGTQITVVLCYEVCVSVSVQGREAIWADPACAECGDDSDHAGYAALVLHGPA